MNNDEEFIKFWNSYQWPEPEPLYFRLYHDDNGRPICYSRHHIPGNYIDITAEQFSLMDMNVKVINGVLVPRSPPPPPKLKPSDQGTACDPRDVTVVVHSGDHVLWNLDYHADN
jgi:hypothetical protein